MVKLGERHCTPAVEASHDRAPGISRVVLESLEMEDPLMVTHWGKWLHSCCFRSARAGDIETVELYLEDNNEMTGSLVVILGRRDSAQSWVRSAGTQSSLSQSRYLGGCLEMAGFLAVTLLGETAWPVLRFSRTELFCKRVIGRKWF